MNSIKSLLSAVAVAALASGAALAGPINNANVNLDPTGVGAPNTGTNGQQICPDALPCANNNFTEPAGNTFTITMLTAGLWSGSITQNQTPSNGGTFNIPTEFTLIGFGSGDVNNPLNDVFLAAGMYTIEVEYDYTGGAGAGSASWAMTMTTAPRPNQVPEPTTLLLMGMALAGFAVARRRRH